jgi:glycosyltransferase involved in cell wall biosynthesis
MSGSRVCAHATTLHLVPSIGPKSFGVGPVVVNLAAQQNRLGCGAEIWCLDAVADAQRAATTAGLDGSRVTTFRVVGPHRLGLSPSMERAAADRASEFDIVHQHGIWTGLSRVTAAARRVHRRPSVVAPHGSLEPWCLSFSRLKKRLALIAYERKNLTEATCLHACSTQELQSCRGFGLTRPVAVIPNGVHDSWLRSDGDARRFRKRYAIGEDARVLLFLSRIHPKKGIPLLLEAISNIADTFCGAVLVIAGVSEVGHERELRGLASRLSLGREVNFVGPLFGQDKRDAFAAADVFVLPTHSENFGIVVLEALGAGVPVLTTKGAPWEELVTHRCGWWVDVDVAAITVAVKDACERPKNDLQEMGRRGRELVVSKYTWSRSAQQTIELYDWILGKRGRPDFVVTT